MLTVDITPWLIGKSVAGGVVNKERALVAARVGLESNLQEAIAVAWKKVSYGPITTSERLVPSFALTSAIVGPLPGLFTKPSTRPD